MSEVERCVGESDCERPIRSKVRLLCDTHLSRLRRRGTTEKYVPPRLSTEERFWSKVDKNGPVPECAPELGPCWIFSSGKPRSGGYGAFWDGTYRAASRPRQVLAHRWAFTAYVQDPGDKDVLHRCDTALCVRYDTHLFLGTRRENVALRDSRGRGGYGEKNPCSKLTEEQVLDIRDERGNGKTFRFLSQKYGVSETTIRGIVEHRNWFHI